MGRLLDSGAGWLYLDPTNDRLVDDSHATVAWGRDYGDVPPVKGVIFTEAKKSKMEVSVDMAEAWLQVVGGPVLRLMLYLTGGGNA